MIANTADRCPWCGTDPLYVSYHDTDWGVPERDGRALWEKLVLDGFQAGLSWITILRKREAFRLAFDGFQPEIVANWGEQEVTRLLGNAGIVRHRGKIEGTILSAQACLRMGGRQAFADYLWNHVGGSPQQNQFQRMADIPPFTDKAAQISKELKALGFKFCGPTIVYAFMQACGLVNDHMIDCHRHDAVKKLARPGPTDDIVPLSRTK